MNLYAYTASSFRAIAEAADALPGESVGEQVPASVFQEIAKAEAKSLRNAMLRQTDWTQIGDSKVTSTEKAAWQLYRQALRDLPQLPGWPNVVWPTPPALSDTAADAVKAAG